MVKKILMIDKGICSMALTKDDKWLFLGSDMPGHVKQIFLGGETPECVKDFGNIHHDGINAMCVSFDNRFLFTTSYDGVLKQISVAGQAVVKDFGQVHYSGIESIVISRNDENLWTSDSLGNVCHISLKADSGFRRTEFPGVHGSCIYA
jgi:WD40 repeat protein